MTTDHSKQTDFPPQFTEIDSEPSLIGSKIKAYTHKEHLLELLKSLEAPPKTTEDLKYIITEGFPEFIDELKKDYPNHLLVLEKLLQDKDMITNLPRRDVQDGVIEKELFSRINKETGGLRDTDTLGVISLDLRSLKILNDAAHDHAIGDAYLHRVSKYIQGDLAEELKAFLGSGMKISIARDGGDEFSIVVSTKDTGISLATEIESQKISSMLSGMANTEKLQRKINTKKSTESEKTGLIEKPTRLIELVTEFVSLRLSQQKHTDIFLQDTEKKEYDQILEALKSDEVKNDPERHKTLSEQLAVHEKNARQKMHKIFDDHINKGVEKGKRILAPEHYELMSHVAAGGTILSDIIDDPSIDDYKQMQLAANPEQAVKQVMGALRSRADHIAYEQKAIENQRLRNSSKPEDIYRFATMSRSDFTNELTRDILNLKAENEDLADQLIELSRKNADTYEALNTCLIDLQKSKMA